MKKQWERPLLVSLVRGGSGEAVLDLCKAIGAGGPNNLNNSCMERPIALCEERALATRIANGAVSCLNCSDIHAS